ncbi:ABC transporter permease [Ursidibacter arcticus]|uniref:ABC transporter permease n=1 Tax=Ursidibacter arcticus TaxID=1524965 RepID=UPI0012F74479|nr:ABC transporter permease [Ursidibacter arcticus]KAE9537791.1 ABC transporter permease [Ursidibacter arcticus]
MKKFLQIFSLIRPLVILLGLFGLWWLCTQLFSLPHYILPPPESVVARLFSHFSLLWQHAQITLLEILIGLLLGCSFGLFTALLLYFSRTLSHFLLPILVISQAIPVFAIAPLLVLWFGYGLASKIVMTVLIIFFPVTAACFDGLRHTPKNWLDLAKTLGVSPLRILLKVQLPAALPALASGLRIAVSIAPIGAVVGEWVGSSEGLGYLMLHANARMQVDLMFAALFMLVIMTLCLYFSADLLLRRVIPWARELR